MYSEVNENRQGQITSTSGYITIHIRNESQIEDVTETSPVPWFNLYSVLMIFLIFYLKLHTSGEGNALNMNNL